MKKLCDEKYKWSRLQRWNRRIVIVNERRRAAGSPKHESPISPKQKKQSEYILRQPDFKLSRLAIVRLGVSWSSATFQEHAIIKICIGTAAAAAFQTPCSSIEYADTSIVMGSNPSPLNPPRGPSVSGTITAVPPAPVRCSQRAAAPPAGGLRGKVAKRGVTRLGARLSGTVKPPQVKYRFPCADGRDRHRHEHSAAICSSHPAEASQLRPSRNATACQ